MTEVIAWLLVLGLVVAIAGIYFLYQQIREHRRDHAEIMLQSNEMVLAHLKRLSDPGSEATDSKVIVSLERRSGDRRRHTAPVAPWLYDRRKSSGRRDQDLTQVAG